jgi:hypothetical protein
VAIPPIVSFARHLGDTNRGFDFVLSDIVGLVVVFYDLVVNALVVEGLVHQPRVLVLICANKVVVFVSQLDWTELVDVGVAKQRENVVLPNRAVGLDGVYYDFPLLEVRLPQRACYGSLLREVAAHRGKGACGRGQGLVGEAGSLHRGRKRVAVVRLGERGIVHVQINYAGRLAQSDFSILLPFPPRGKRSSKPVNGKLMAKY